MINKNCTNCNSVLKETSVYCNSCGTKNAPSKLDNWANVYLQLGETDLLSQINQNPLSWQWCVTYGNEAYDLMEYYEAIEYFTKALEFNIKEAEKLSHIYNMLGISYGQVQISDKCRLYLDLCISANPKNFVAWQNRAAYKIFFGENEAGLEDLRHLMENMEMQPKGWYFLGMAFENLKDYQKARMGYEKAIKEGYTIAKENLEELLKKWPRN